MDETSIRAAYSLIRILNTLGVIDTQSYYIAIRATFAVIFREENRNPTQNPRCKTHE